jgi:glycine oxidase
VNPDVIIAGGGIIGLSLALELQRAGASVVVFDRGEPGREASYAAAGMLAAADSDLHPALRPLASASAQLYPAFVHQLELLSGLKTGMSRLGALSVAEDDEHFASVPLSPQEVRELEPGLARQDGVHLLEETCVDPRLLTQAAITAAKRSGVVVHHESRIHKVRLDPEHQLSVSTPRAAHTAANFVNCCGAWAGEVLGSAVPARPRKGQMLSVIAPECRLHHVVRSRDVYLVPRKDGRILIGATVEDVGFDKNVEPATIQRLHQAAANLVPSIGEGKILEAWAGLRPGSPDDLPIMGAGHLPGTFISTGHFRNGILLAPISALLMSQFIQGKKPDIDIQAFSPARFRDQQKRK